MPDARELIRLGVPAFVLAYLLSVTLLTLANNGWYPIGTGMFCGSLGDFHGGPVPTVCLSFVDYWSRAVSHPPYAVLSAIAGLVVSGALLSRRGTSDA